jgi:hypothetical protein
MRKVFFLFLISSLTVSTLFSQSICDTGYVDIRTNYLNPKPANDSLYTNNWNWKTASWGGYYYGSQYYLNSPFETSQTMYDLFTTVDPRDNQWEDGWELIKRDFGYLNDEITPKGSNYRKAPYFMLYNKFSGKLRIFFAFESLVISDSVIVQLEIPKSNNGYVNAGLSTHARYASALDQNTEVIRVKSSVINPGTSINFGYAEFPFTYDPCVCFFPSQLLVNFRVTTEFDAKLALRLIGTSTPIDLFQPDNLSNLKQFMSTLYSDISSGVNVYSGIQTFNTIQEMLDQYENSKIEIDEGVQKILDFFTVALDKINPTLSLGSSILGTESPLDENAQSALELFGLITEKFSMNTSSNSFPSVLQAEGAIGGKIRSNPAVNGLQINLHYPGSDRSTRTNTFRYDKTPVWDNPLGVFALIKTPKIKMQRWSGLLNQTSPSMCYLPPCGYSHFGIRYSFNIQDSVLYAINPALNPNLNRSQIYGSIIIKRRKRFCEPSINPNSTCSTLPNGYEEVGNMRRLYTVLDTTEFNHPSYFTDSVRTYASPFVPLNGIHELHTSVNTLSLTNGEPSVFCCDTDSVDINAYLRIMVFLESNQLNKNGKPNTAMHIFTYPLDLEINNVGRNYIDSLENKFNIPFNLMLDSNYVITGDTVRAWDTIFVKRNLSSVNGVLHIIAGSAVITEGSYSILPNVNMQVGKPIEVEPVAKPVARTYVNSFCQSLLYKAKATASKNNLESDYENTELNFEPRLDPFSFDVSPNPFDKSTNLTLINSSATSVSIEVRDLLGNLVHTVVSQASIDAGTHTFELKVDFPAGVYFVQCRAGEQVLTRRVVHISQ